MGAGGSESALARLPWRGPGDDRPPLPLPPDRLPILGTGRRMRKRWRYVGVFCEELMLCGARVEVGPFGQSFWAVLDRATGELIERTRKRAPFARGEVWSERAGDSGAWPLGSPESGVRTRIEGRREGVAVKLQFGEGRWVESICPTEEADGRRGYVWTRKRIAPVDCDIQLPGERRIRTSGFGIEDESAGYHPRHTVWSWSAGVGTAADGRAVGWNLVSGINDPPVGSERAIWIEGEPYEPGPVSFDGLEAIKFGAGDEARLRFEAEAERSAEEKIPGLRSSYRQPFGRFSGSLDGIDLAEGLGVMEFHDVWW